MILLYCMFPLALCLKRSLSGFGVSIYSNHFRIDPFLNFLTTYFYNSNEFLFGFGPPLYTSSLLIAHVWLWYYSRSRTDPLDSFQYGIQRIGTHNDIRDVMPFLWRVNGNTSHTESWYEWLRIHFGSRAPSYACWYEWIRIKIWIQRTKLRFHLRLQMSW